MTDRCPQCTAEGMTPTEKESGVCYDCQRANRQARAAYERGRVDERRTWSTALQLERRRRSIASRLIIAGPAEGDEG